MNVREKLAEFQMLDVAILQHGYTTYMRDYDVLTEAGGVGAGRYRYRFTHVPYVEILTSVKDEAWDQSWDDLYTDYQNWTDSGDPDGFVWGVCWSMAYPGLSYIEDSDLGRAWTKRFGKPMHEALIETEAFSLRLIFHDVSIQKMSNDVAIMDKAIIQLSN